MDRRALGPLMAGCVSSLADADDMVGECVSRKLRLSEEETRPKPMYRSLLHLWTEFRDAKTGMPLRLRGLTQATRHGPADDATVGQKAKNRKRWGWLFEQNCASNRNRGTA